MAEMDEQKNTAMAEAQQGLRAFLCSEERDFLIRNNGDEVKVEDLEGKIVGFYFAAHQSFHCRLFTPLLSEVYTKLLDKGDFEIIFVSDDNDEKSFEEYHKAMPWLALPFSDVKTKKKIKESFNVVSIPTLVFLDKECKYISAVERYILRNYGAEAYPFTKERLDELKAKEEAIRLSQTLESLLVSPDRDFVIANGGKQVAVSELVGKTVCLYFSAHWSLSCQDFTHHLIEFYNERRRRREELEIVFISVDRDEGSFQECFGRMPWLALPFGDKTVEYLSRYFQKEWIPALVVLGPDGKTLLTEALGLIFEHGVLIYPFTKEKLAELEAVRAAQTLESLLIHEERDFVITHGGGRVAVSELVGKTVCLYFSAHWSSLFKDFTPHIIEFYNEVRRRGEELEIVFISSDRDEASFQEYFGRMPWLALPFGDKTGEYLSKYFQMEWRPNLIVLGPDGKTLQTKGVELIMEHGISIYPFTKEKLDELKVQDEAKRAAQTLESLFTHEERDFVITHGGGRVAVSELVGKTVCLYFSAHRSLRCRFFIRDLIEFYNKLRRRGEELEIVFISSDRDEASFQEYFGSMPWLALPFGDKRGKYLSRYFQIEWSPNLIVLGPDGKTLQTKGVELIMEHGVSISPFTKEKLYELKVRLAAQTLESLLIHEERDFVITHGDGRVPVSQLTGKTVGLFFSAHYYPQCRQFTQKLAQVYTELKRKKKAFEIVFLSNDRDQAAFEEYYTTMPWLALPWRDKVEKDLSHFFDVGGIPTLAIIGPDGKTVTRDGIGIVSVYGAKAYPFTEARFAELQEEMEEKAKTWPKEVEHFLHEHPLALTQRKPYNCDGCDRRGILWSFCCEECEFDLHPNCALKNVECEDEASNDENKAAGVICEVEVCRNV